jgi:hypothetical protein
VPLGQAVQFVAPLAAEKKPGAQGVHATADDARVVGFAEPGTHGTGAPAPGGQ